LQRRGLRLVGLSSPHRPTPQGWCTCTVWRHSGAGPGQPRRWYACVAWHPTPPPCEGGGVGGATVAAGVLCGATLALGLVNRGVGARASLGTRPPPRERGGVGGDKVAAGVRCGATLALGHSGSGPGQPRSWRAGLPRVYDVAPLWRWAWSTEELARVRRVAPDPPPCEGGGAVMTRLPRVYDVAPLWRWAWSTEELARVRRVAPDPPPSGGGRWQHVCRGCTVWRHSGPWSLHVGGVGERAWCGDPLALVTRGVDERAWCGAHPCSPEELASVHCVAPPWAWSLEELTSGRDVALGSVHSRSWRMCTVWRHPGRRCTSEELARVHDWYPPPAHEGGGGGGSLQPSTPANGST